MKFLFKTFCFVVMLCFIYKTVNSVVVSTEHSCTDSQTITKLEPLYARKIFKYLVTGDKGTKALTSNNMAEEDVLKLKVGDQYCFKETINFNWDRFLESFTKL